MASTSSAVLGERLGASSVGDDDREDALAVLAGRLCDELLGPVAEAGVARPGVGEDQLVDAGAVGRAEQGPGDETGVVGRVGLERRAGGVGLVEQGTDVGAGETARHQAERRERGVASTDVGVGEEDAITGLARRRLQRRAGVGDDDDALGGVDAGVAERLLEGTPLAVGLDRPSRLAGHDDDRLRRGGPRARSARSRGRRSRSTVRSTPAAPQITSGASDEPPMPHSTTWTRPASAQLAPRAPRCRRRDRATSAAGATHERPLAGSLLGLRAPQRGVLGGDARGHARRRRAARAWSQGWRRRRGADASKPSPVRRHTAS